MKTLTVYQFAQIVALAIWPLLTLGVVGVLLIIRDLFRGKYIHYRLHR